MTDLRRQADEAKIAVISNDVVYIKESLVEIKTTLREQSQLYALKTDLVALEKELEEAKRRITELESWKYKAIGFAAAISVGLVWVKDLFMRH